jgi:hypothetical protein
VTIHPPDCDCTSLGCTIRRGGGLQIPPSATPTRTPQFAPRQPRFNSWEKGVAGETRPDGSFMPYLATDEAGDTRQVHVKEWSESPHLRAIRARQLSEHPAEVTPTPVLTTQE